MIMRGAGGSVADVMFTELIPTCPRLHYGAVVQDDCREGGREWVCRVCGIRLYGNDAATAAVAQVTQEKPYNDGYNLYRKTSHCRSCQRPSDNHLLCRNCRRR